MNYQEFQELLTPNGQNALSAAVKLAPKEETFLANLHYLSKQYSRDLSRTALVMAMMRKKAEKKFPFASEIYFIKEALEQATSWEVAKHRAKRYVGFDWVFDLCSSIGSDSLAIANFAKVIAFEKDFLRSSIANTNSNIINQKHDIVNINTNVDGGLYLNENINVGLFFDPARRGGFKRKFNVNDYTPPLSTIKSWKNASGIGVKLSPGVNLAQIQEYDCEVEFVSLHGELKEAVLWMDGLKTGHRSATLLPAGICLTDEDSPTLATSPPKAYIYEPDPAIIRSGMVTSLANHFDSIFQLDSQIAYLTSDEKNDTPLARRWEVEDWMPFNLKKLKAYLRERDVGPITVKKRGSPITPETLQSKLKLKGNQSRTLFLTKFEDSPIVIIAKDILVVK